MDKSRPASQYTQMGKETLDRSLDRSPVGRNIGILFIYLFAQLIMQPVT